METRGREKLPSRDTPTEEDFLYFSSFISSDDVVFAIKLETNHGESFATKKINETISFLLSAL